MDPASGRIPGDLDAAIREISARENRSEAALMLAAIANRAAAALHQLARAEASSRKGQADWGRWASLTNVSRDAVLRTAACRQSASQLAKSSPDAAPPTET